MKKSSVFIFLFVIHLCSAQFVVKVDGPQDFSESEAYLYILNGSKDVIAAKSNKEKDSWIFKMPNQYKGMMKIYFPKTNLTISCIAENNNVDLSFTLYQNKINHIDYKDFSNQLFYQLQDQQKKKEQILPALYQIQNYYTYNSPFGLALQKEMESLNTAIPYSSAEHPFIEYYSKNYHHFLSSEAEKKPPTNEEVIHFLNTTSHYFETSSLLKPLLMLFLSNTSQSILNEEVDRLIKTVDVESPRGQVILSELIEIFSVYNIKDLKEKYLKEARSLKCSLNDRLSSTIKSNLETAIGKTIPNTKFKNPVNTKSKDLHGIKADKKIVLLWSSTCPHCEKEISEILLQYKLLKSKNIEVVGLSLDTDSKSYSDKVQLLPWVNDTELKGWYSSYVEVFNVHATPTFYLVDAQNKIIATPENFSEALAFLGIK